MFFRLGTFNTQYGHKGSILGLNEDVVFQDVVRQNGGSITYDPELTFIHHWHGTKEQIIERICLQGIYDRQSDLMTNRFRFIMRMIKYICCIIKYHLQNDKSIYCEKHFDYMRYSAYVTNRKKKPPK